MKKILSSILIITTIFVVLMGNVVNAAENVKKDATKQEEVETESPEKLFVKKVKKVCKKVVGKKNVKNVEYYNDSSGSLLIIELKTNGLSEKTDTFSANYDAVEIMKKLSKNKTFKSTDEVRFVYRGTFVDIYGNESEEIAFKIFLSKDTISKINFKEFNSDNLPTIADYYESNI